MIWTLELASFLDDAPWPATKEELIDYKYLNVCGVATFIADASESKIQLFI